jgi:hypothetical protein
MKGILKTVAITATAIVVFWIAFFFRKEIIDWADKPADNASVTLIVVVVCYLFSLPINHKLNKILNFIHGSDYEHESEEE